MNRLYKAELIQRRAPWNIGESMATLEWVAWFNLHRLLKSIGYFPSAEADANDYQQLANEATSVAWLKPNGLHEIRGGS